MGVLDQIGGPADVKALPSELLPVLCAELRELIIKNVAEKGGHLASNLGAVELIVAIHRVFDTSRDRLVFDVGHQSYAHKILTGRRGEFNTLRQFGGLSGFPKPSESRHDASSAGHASVSISTALGMARARTLSRGDLEVIALLGDGALTGGMAFEALSDAGESGEPLIIILNDNGMSITDNVGGVARYLTRQRIKPSYVAFKRRYRRLMEILPGGRGFYKFTHAVKDAIKAAILHCSMFEEMGLNYVGPVDGHDITSLTEALIWAKQAREPMLVHVITQKGRGCSYAEREPELYHSVKPFDWRTGIIPAGQRTFSDVFGAEMETLAQSDPQLCAITASMTSGTGLSGFAQRFPDRFFDVGIAEEHAAAMAAGMASQGITPVFAVYSTFLQRSYDMLLHDVALNNLHVVFAVDRAGLVPGDGETHQGVFDPAFLATVPNMSVWSPSSFAELRDMLRLAVSKSGGPVAVRYPRGGEGDYKDGGTESVKRVREGTDFTVVTYGISVNTALEAAEILQNEGISIEILKLGRINPFDFDTIAESVRKTDGLLMLEECAGRGGIGEAAAARFTASGRKPPEHLLLLNTGDRFLPCGSTADLRKLCGLDADSVCVAIRGALGR